MKSMQLRLSPVHMRKEASQLDLHELNALALVLAEETKKRI